VPARELHLALEQFAQDPLLAARLFRNKPGKKPGKNRAGTYLHKRSPARIAQHVWPESTCTNTGETIHVDFIGRTEHTDEDVRAMVLLINQRTPDQPPLIAPPAKLAVSNTQTYDKSRVNFTRAFYDHICASYASDMGLFPDTQCARALAASIH
jgi:hypothetical protein